MIIMGILRIEIRMRILDQANNRVLPSSALGVYSLAVLAVTAVMITLRGPFHRRVECSYLRKSHLLVPHIRSHDTVTVLNLMCVCRA